MKRKELKKFYSRPFAQISSIILATSLVFAGGMNLIETGNKNVEVPELVTFVDDEGVVEIVEDDTPLAAPKVTTTTKTTKKTKKIKLKKASKRTYDKKGKSSTKKSTKKSVEGAVTTTTQTIVNTSILNKFKKGSKIQTQVTTTKTTTIKTVTTAKTSTGQNAATPTNSVSGNITARALAPKADTRVINAYETLGFKVILNPSVTYSGLFDARTRTITLKRTDYTIYHELGHFLAFIAGNVDLSPEFMDIYEAEQSAYTAFNRSYVLSTSSEYFAESFRNYTENPNALKAARPRTYAAIVDALNTITPSQISRLALIYSAIWND